MAKLLYIESSPRKVRAYSIKVAQRFLDSYKQANPTDTVETLDLWSTPLPAFDGATIDAKYRILHGENHTDSEVGPGTASWNDSIISTLPQSISSACQCGISACRTN